MGISTDAESIEELSGITKRGHRCLLTKAGRSELWYNAARSLGEVSMRQTAQAHHALTVPISWQAEARRQAQPSVHNEASKCQSAIWRLTSSAAAMLN